jgi:hypothetical protein
METPIQDKVVLEMERYWQQYQDGYITKMELLCKVGNSLLTPGLQDELFASVKKQKEEDDELATPF